VSAGRILVVDDDPKIAGLLQRGLSLKGFEVAVAEDGERGRAAWTAGGFDLILLDVMLPQVDGLSLCAERRRAGDRTPVILLTARDDDTLREQAMALEISDHVVKPFAYGDLVARIRQTLLSNATGRSTGSASA
jgi:DNA-binding response OmpR family regulator